MSYHIHWHIQEIEKAYQSGDLSSIITELKSMAYNTVGFCGEIKLLISIVAEYSKGQLDKEDFESLWHDDFVNGLKHAVEMTEDESIFQNVDGGQLDAPKVI